MADQEKYNITAENAREMARRAVEARTEKGIRRAPDPLRAVRRKAGPMLRHLADAVEGKGIFAAKRKMKCPSCDHVWNVSVPTLPPDKRLQALLALLQYAAGRPVALDKLTPDLPVPPGVAESVDDDEGAVEPAEGLTFG